MKKIILCSIVLIISMVVKEVNAYTGVLTRVPVDNMYYVGTSDLNTISYQYKLYDIDGVPAFCIEPGVDITNDIYYGNDDLNYFDGITSSDIRKMSLYAYYSNGYPGHDNERYRAAAQLLIWDVLKNYEFTFYTGASGTGDVIDLSKEMEDIKNLVDSHKIYPSFAGEPIKMNVGEKLVLEDANKILSSYNVTFTSGAYVTIENNNLIVEVKNAGTFKISFKKKSYSDEPILLQYNGDSQKMITRGEVILPQFYINIDAYDTNISINKKGEIFNYGNYTEISLEDIKFDLYAADTIYDSYGQVIYNNDEYIQSVYTNENGFAYINNLFYGKYYVKENSHLNDYIKNEEKYYFEISEGTLKDGVFTYDLNIKNYLKKANIEILKIDGMTLLPLSNVEFQLSDESGNIILTDVTDLNGIMTFNNLPLGNYYLKELNTNVGYVPNEEVLEIKLSKEDNIYQITITNERIIEIPDTYLNEYEIVTSINIMSFFAGAYVYINNKKYY